MTLEECLGDVIGDPNSRHDKIHSFGNEVGRMKVVDALIPLTKLF